MLQLSLRKDLAVLFLLVCGFSWFWFVGVFEVWGFFESTPQDCYYWKYRAQFLREVDTLLKS